MLNPLLQQQIQKGLNKFRQSVSQVRISKNTPTIGQAAQQAWNNNLFSNMTRTNTPIKPINNIVQKAGFAGEGLLENLSFGTVNIPNRAPVSRGEQSAKMAGGIAGLFAPVGVASKVLAPVGKTTETLAGLKLAKLGLTGKKLNVGRVLAGEAAQTGVVGGIRAATGQQFDPMQDLGYGLGARGILGGAGKFLRPLAQARRVDKLNSYDRMLPEDQKLIADVLERLNFRDTDLGYFTTQRPQDIKALRGLFEMYGSEKMLSKMSDDDLIKWGTERFFEDRQVGDMTGAMGLTQKGNVPQAGLYDADRIKAFLKSSNYNKLTTQEQNKLNNLVYSLRNFNGKVDDILNPAEKKLVDRLRANYPEFNQLPIGANKVVGSTDNNLIGKTAPSSPELSSLSQSGTRTIPTPNSSIYGEKISYGNLPAKHDKNIPQFPSFNQYYKDMNGYRGISQGMDTTGDYVNGVIDTLTGKRSDLGKINQQAIDDARNIINTHSLHPERDLARLDSALNPRVAQPSIPNAGLGDIDQITSKYPNVKLDAYDNGKQISISRIEVPKDQRNQGIGTKAMQDIIDLADQQGKRIVLTPSGDFGGSKSRLVEFYKRLGFVENKGRTKDFTTRETMYRDPRVVQSRPVASSGGRVQDAVQDGVQDPRVAQPSIPDTKATEPFVPDGMMGFVGTPNLSQKARLEGITTPRTGADLAVPTQQAIKARVKNQPKLVGSQLNQSKPLSQSVGMSSRMVDSVQPSRAILSESKKSLGELESMQKQSIEKSSAYSPKNSFDDIIKRSDINVKDKVGALDYLRTPDRVFEKVGLKKEVELLRRKEDDYLKELPVQIDKITQWSKQVPPESNQRIFKYLDGQPIQLDSQELKVAGEIKQYLEYWADRLNLPKDKRITNYITHIFDKDFIKKEFDPDIARLIRDRVPGSVYDPFVEQRLGKAGYIEDTWQALDAYVKRATRKANMDVALQEISKKADQLEDSQFRYIKGRLDRINMRPTWIDNMIDNTIKSSPIGYRLGQRPTARITKVGRQWVYRATLGLNPGTALKNLTQGANTYAKLGEKYTTKGYMRLLKNFNSDELEKVGVLKKDIIQDRTINATNKFWEKADKGLFVFFELAEKINRGAAYYGAKAKALDKGLSEEEAIQAGLKMVRDTQFTFGAVDTPAILSSDILKTMFQFQSFSLKQSEFLIEMAKNKEFAGLVRWSAASLGLVYTIGQLIGMDPEDIIPSFRFGVPPTLQAPIEAGKALLNTPDQYGNPRDLRTKAEDVGKKALLYVPAATQIKKTYSGLKDTSRGYATSRSGRIKYPVDQDNVTKLRAGIFGSSTLPQAQEYFDSKSSPLGEKQSQKFLDSADPKAYYDKVMGDRQAKKESGTDSSSSDTSEIRERVKSSGKAELVNDVWYYRENGSVKSLQTKRPMIAPELTGQPDLDKKLWSSFKSKVSSRQSEVSKLYQMGHITAEEAEKEIDRLERMKTPKGKLKKGKKLSLKISKIKAPTGRLKTGGGSKKLPKLKAVKLKTRKGKLVFKKPKKLNLKALQA